MHIGAIFKLKQRFIQTVLAYILIFTLCCQISIPAMANPESETTETENQEGNLSQAQTAAVNVSCEGAVLMEASTGTILFEKEPAKQLRPASVTKVMTLLLIFEALEKGAIHYDDVVTISAHAAGMGGSQVFLEENEQQTVETLIKCISIASANDACVAMAEFIAGSEEEFVARMNEKASSLSMNNTHFVNCCGLDADGHLTSAMDVAIMSRELINKYPEVHKFTTIWMDEFEHVTKKGSSVFQLANTNKLISTYPYATGLKTGSTSLAKYSVSATATKDEITLIAVVMADVDYKIRFTDAQKLLDYGFANCQVYKDNEPPNIKPLKIKNGIMTTVPLNYETVFSYVDTKGSNLSEITTKLEIPDYLKAPIDSSKPVGTLDYYLGEEKIGSINIYPAVSVPKITYGYCLRQLLFSILP